MTLGVAALASALGQVVVVLEVILVVELVVVSVSGNVGSASALNTIIAPARVVAVGSNLLTSDYAANTTGAATLTGREDHGPLCVSRDGCRDHKGGGKRQRERGEELHGVGCEGFGGM